MAYDQYPAVDEDLLFAPEVREANAAAPEFRSQVVPMTQTARNNLTGDDLWDNRLIFNTTTDRIDRYDAGSTTWIQVTSEPAGIIKEYGGDTAPSFHVLADGSVYPRTGIYAGLFAVFGTKYNTGGEAGDEFRVVNRKGKVGVGKDSTQTEFDTLGKVGGVKTVTLTEAQIPAHDHAGTTDGENAVHTHSVDPTDVVAHQHNLPLMDQPVQSGTGATVQKWTASSAQTSDAGGSQAIGATVGNESAPHGHTFATDSAGGGGAHSNLQPFVTVNYIITL